MSLDRIRPLRGRVVVRPDSEAASSLIIDPNAGTEKSQRDRKTTIHFGTVVAAGPPARTKWGHEVPHDLGPGDRVLFVYAVWLESMRAYDGLCVVSQEEIQAVLEP